MSLCLRLRLPAVAVSADSVTSDGSRFRLRFTLATSFFCLRLSLRLTLFCSIFCYMRMSLRLCRFSSLFSHFSMSCCLPATANFLRAGLRVHMPQSRSSLRWADVIPNPPQYSPNSPNSPNNLQQSPNTGSAAPTALTHPDTPQTHRSSEQYYKYSQYKIFNFDQVQLAKSASPNS